MSLYISFNYYRLTEALKNGGLKRTLKNLGLDEGIGANGELTDDQLNTPIENEDCQRVFENVRATYQSLDAAVPGDSGHFPLNLCKSLLCRWCLWRCGH